MSATERLRAQVFAAGKAAEARGERPTEYVLVGDKTYPHDAFLAAFNTTGLAVIERALPEGVTLRQMGRNLAALKDPKRGETVLREALRLLITEVEPVEMSDPRGIIVARFPAP
jgi:hypothetical protein